MAQRSNLNVDSAADSTHLNPAPKSFSFEKLETRQLMSTAVLMATDKMAIRIAHFETQITRQVENHLSHASSLAFQKLITAEQNHFAAAIAKAGGSYTPIDYSALVTTATTDKAEQLTQRIATEITKFQSLLLKQVHNHPRLWRNVHFQNLITAEQTHFAAHIARQGGTYTPVPFELLTFGVVPPTVGTSSTVPTLSYTVASSAEIDLTWTTITGALAYKLEQSVDGGTTWAALTTTASTSYSNFGLTADTSYQYRISAISSGGTSAASSPITVSTLLNPPTRFTAVVTNATTVTLHWATVTHVVNYKVERSINTTTWTSLSATVGAGAVSYADSTAIAGTSYFYRVSAIDAAGTSAPTSLVTITTTPAAPVLTGTSISASEIDLSWAVVPTAYSYKLESSLNGTRWSLLTTTSTNTYNHTGLTADSTHQYRISAINGTGTSAVSSTLIKTTLLGTPTGLTATTSSTTAIALRWIPVSDAITYKLERSLNNTTWTVVSATLAHTPTTYSDTGLSGGTLYYYRLSANNTAGTSVPSAVAHTTTLAIAPVATGTITSATAISLSWPAVTGATAYKIETSVNNGVTWSTLVASQAGLTYAQSGLAPNSTHKYRVSAISATGVSAPSTVVSLTTYTAAPTGLTVAATSATSIYLTWTAVPGATGYKLERSLDNTTWTLVSASTSFTGSTVSYTDTTVLAGTRYYYRLSSIATTATSGATSAVNALTYPAAPVVTPAVVSSSAITLNWVAVTGAATYKVEQSSNGGSSWTTLAASQAGVTYAAVSLTADTSYAFRVTSINATGTSAGTVVTSTTALTAPTNFTASVTSATNVHLIWTPVTDAANYKLERSANNTTWTTVTTSFNGASASFDDATVAAGTTYYYRLSAINTAGTSTAALSNPTQLLTLPGVTTLTGLVVSATALTLNWTAVTGAASYTLETSADAGATWSTLSLGSPTALTYAHTALTADTSHQYRVTAVNATGSGAATAPLILKTMLAAPGGFASVVNSATSVTLNWTTISDATSYKIERQTAGTWAALTTIPSGATATYTDTTVLAGTTYSYRISAINTLGTSTPGTAIAVLSLPIAPTVTAVANSVSQITLSWVAVASATSYKLEYSPDAGTTWNLLANQSTLTFVQSGLIGDTSYQYRCTASNATGNSALSAVLTTSTLLASPTNFTATVASATSVTLGWTAVTHATTYKIERSLDNGVWTTLATPGVTGSSTSFTDTVAGGTSYYYRISSTGAAGTSVATAAAHVLTIPIAPVLSAALISATQINLSWTACLGATSYRLDSSNDGSTWTSVVSQTALTFSNTGLTSDTAYHYRVYAIDATGPSLVSNSPATITTYLAAPASFAAAVTTATNVNLTWTVVVDAASYKIERSVDNTTFTTLTTINTQATAAYSDTTPLAGTQYYYRISAADTVGSSALSPVASALTLSPTPTLTATPTSATSISLTWNAVLSAHTYKLEKGTTSGGMTTWATLASPSITSYTDTGLTADTAYQYRVSGVNATGPSVASSVQTATTPQLVPASFVVSAATPTRVNIGWTAQTDATGYRIERSADNVTWTALAGSSALIGTDTSYSDTTVVGGTNYYYRMSSNSLGGYSATTAVAHVMTVPAAPTITGTVFSSTQLNLAWNAVTGATSYTISLYDTGSSTWLPITPEPVGAVTSFSVTGLTADTAYSYAVDGNDATGAGPNSLVAVNLTTKLAAPVLTATSSSATSVSLSWPAIAHATSYLLQRSTAGGAYSTLAAPGGGWSASSAAYTDSTVVGGTSYSYQLSAIDASGSSAPATQTVLTRPAAPVLAGAATSSTALNLTWAAVKSATSYTLQLSDGSGGWTNVSPGPIGAVTSYPITGLTADTAYTYQLIANNATGASVASNSLALSTILTTPTFTTSSTSATTATLTFSAAADATSYVVQRSLDGTIWSTVSNALNGTSTSFGDTGLSAGTTYHYRLADANASGTSAWATGTVLTLPAAPVMTGSVVSATSLSFAWTPIKSATSYTLKLSDGSGGWTTVSPGPVGAATSVTVTGLTADTAYTYELIANNATGASAASSSVALSTDLAAPVFGSNTATATAVTLNWTAIAHATSYLLQRSTDGTIWTTITNSLGASDAMYVDSTVAAGTTYTYKLSAIDAAGTSAAATATVLTEPAAPTLSFDVVSSTSLLLSWTASTSATAYTVESSSVSGGVTTWTAVSPGPVGAATSLTITGLTADTAYTYHVIATNATGNSLASTSVVATTLLASPSAFAVTVTNATTVHLAWTANADATGYLVERSENGTIWTTVVQNTLGSGSATYNDTTAVQGTSYEYRLSAISAAGTSDPTSPITVLTNPDAPVLTGATASATELDLTWTPVQSATSYTLESYDGSVWSAVSPQPVGAVTSINLTGLTAGTAYTYRIKANNATGASAASASLVITTLLGAPTGFAAASTTATSVHLTWTALTGATAYVIEQSTDGSNWTQLSIGTPITGTTFTDSTVTAGNTYQYRISASNTLGVSDPCTPITVITPLAAATGLAATVNSSTQITLNWNQDTDSGLTGYRLEISTDGTTWTTAATLGTSATTVADSGLTASTLYHFRLFALSAGGDSAASAVVNATTTA